MCEEIRNILCKNFPENKNNFKITIPTSEIFLYIGINNEFNKIEIQILYSDNSYDVFICQYWVEPDSLFDETYLHKLSDEDKEYILNSTYIPKAQKKRFEKDFNNLQKIFKNLIIKNQDILVKACRD